MQSEDPAEAEEGRWVSEGVPRWFTIECHRDGPEDVLYSFWQGHGGCNHVRPREEEITW